MNNRRVLTIFICVLMIISVSFSIYFYMESQRFREAEQLFFTTQIDKGYSALNKNAYIMNDITSNWEKKSSEELSLSLNLLASNLMLTQELWSSLGYHYELEYKNRGFSSRFLSDLFNGYYAEVKGIQTALMNPKNENGIKEKLYMLNEDLNSILTKMNKEVLKQGSYDELMNHWKGIVAELKYQDVLEFYYQKHPNMK